MGGGGGRSAPAPSTTRRRPGPSSLIAAAAVFIALGGGAVAATTSGSRTVRWAVVRADGALARSSSGVVSSTRLFSAAVRGSYQVNFDSDVRRCGLVATLGRTNSAPMDPEPGEVGVAYPASIRRAST
ncbi:MAG: hypothetical protein U0R52_11705 [Solirubrobacterales bacterium]